MGDRKAPTPPPTNQSKPDPPPAPPRKRSAASECQHGAFSAAVRVVRLEDVGQYVAELRIACEECGLPFGFGGLPRGLHSLQPTVSFDQTELRAPIFPGARI